MAAQNLVQSSQNPPAQPAYILRGHSAQVHAVNFLRDNTRLLTGDADGWVVLWSTSTKRATAVWKAHSNAILGLRGWEHDKIITHGRDNKLRVWQLRETDEPSFSKILPIEDSNSDRKDPWLLHTLQVNALNFCSFAMCHAMPASAHLPSHGIFIGTPGVEDGHINVTSLPDEDRLATIPNPKDESTGMVMSIDLAFHPESKQLLILGGYESGHACVWSQQDGRRQWQLTYMRKGHTQPVLSLDIALDHKCFFTSSADAIIGRHPLNDGDENLPAKTVQTKHAGQQGLTVRNDGKIFATAGWDSRIRVYSVRTMKELAVLKWHKEGCYAISFAKVAKSAAESATLGMRQKDDQEISDMTIAQQREYNARTTHWLAAGSKDGKVSLWDIY
ncbi:uncharacterized protein MYCFIDRAFT_43661 [Pseudocercospora fijiensis CIRAD86]|uniref:ASTRA-associated protein 1 n=1 Tax=Pseudocercospora fijiensis (strain CIRAD86) TaxID=383855 RepID=M2YMD8_PSEFD|nr:uncharacterized protein MYCFIDRAFT_43661 [Pseudocercospora fijiensis CIRAD86]EME78905.1 hypothetical protein MYCFIDRAFT_43661 [Pseudocercospora fijiensis CIRAD86]